ncbi:GlcNAc-transferase family protein [Caenimonas koreensis]|uniref:Glycosyltransferase (GlcNAc) n=1 Tax=Caenimonas koreensis DSM 17982 TaxID=1121255 RepID=A0A844B6A8_9BURK|nr:GlcNAc-transferase family protein [Caenimonas koreensis]MRD48712.1 hypothetical protein [Caenimonas koreensis DSM 17982]
MSVFISIAAYSDPVLPFTVQRAVRTARWPAKLHFGVVDQSPAPPPGASAPSAGLARMSYVRIDPVYARGPCWARAIAMSLYDGEDWFFQIDSHMDFDEHWDEKLIEEATALMRGRTGIVISSYPNPFIFEESGPVPKPTTTKVLAHVVKPNAEFEAGHPVLGFEAHPLDADEPVPGMHLGAGCLFAPGHLVHAVPYDPWFYFHGEEQAITMRLYTHGWDIFHMPGLPVYHLYNSPGSGGPPRPMHWDAKENEQRPQQWWKLEERSRQRLADLLAGKDLGIYSLGKQRSLADFAAFSGIDYVSRTISELARRPQRTRP